MDDYLLIKVTELPAAEGLTGVVLLGVETGSDRSVQVPVSILKALIDAAMLEATTARNKADAALDALPIKVEMLTVDETDFPELTI